jgi:hypothetical protein
VILLLVLITCELRPTASSELWRWWDEVSFTSSLSIQMAFVTPRKELWEEKESKE